MANYIFVNGINRFQETMTGGHRRYLELIRYLSASNSVTLVSAPIPEFEDNKNIQQVAIPVNKTGKLPYSWSGLIHSVKGLHKIKKEDYDWAVSFGAWQTMAFRWKGIHRIMTLFREDPISYMQCVEENPARKVLKYLYLSFVETIAVACSKRMIVQCHDDYRNLQKRHFFLRKKIARSTYIQTNNINPSWVACEGELELPPAGDAMVRVAYIASFDDKRKGSDILFPAVVRLMKEEYGVVLYVAGEGRNLAELKRNYGSCGNIIFLGQIADSGALLRQVDFSVVPSHRDSCPNTVLESLYAGTTVYGSNVGGIKEILKGEFLFEDSEEGVYHFLKNKLDQEAWKADKIKQQDLCCGLRFNWGEKIEAYMKEA